MSVFSSTADSEAKYLSAAVATYFGGRGALTWLLATAKQEGENQYNAVRHLAALRIGEVKPLIEERLRSLGPEQGDLIAGLLESWSLFGEALPEDLRERLSDPKMPKGVGVALRALGL